MTRNVFYLLVFLLCFKFGYSQNSADTVILKTRSIIKFYPLQTLTGEARFSFEKRLKNGKSIEIGCGYIFGFVDGETDAFASGGVLPDPNYHGFTIRTSIKGNHNKSGKRRMFQRKSLFMYKYAHAIESYGKDQIHELGFQFIFEYNSKNSRRVSLQPYFGAGLKSGIEIFSDPIYGDKYIYHFTYPTIQLGFAIGYKIKKK